MKSLIFLAAILGTIFIGGFFVNSEEYIPNSGGDSADVGQYTPVTIDTYDSNRNKIQMTFTHKPQRVVVDELNTMLKDLSNITITIREMPTDVIIRTEMNLYPENIILDIATNSAMVKFKRLSQEAISALTVKNMAETAQSNIEYLAMMLEVEL